MALTLAVAAAAGCTTSGSDAAAAQPASPASSPSVSAVASPESPASPGAASAASAGNSAFDAMRAFDDLKKQVAFGPRVPETAPHDACRDWILAELKKSAGNASRQDFTYDLGGGKKLAMSNLYAVFNPGAKTQVMLCAHWDTRPQADQEIDPAKKKMPIPGADDGASGVAVLLELAREFAAKNPSAGVQIVFFDGEDFGPGEDRMYLGADKWSKHPPLPKPDYAILIDMIGNKNVSIPREKNSDLMAPEINDKIWNAASATGHLEFSTKEGLMIDDDHIPLQKVGWKAVDLIDFDYGPWHTLDDTPDKCSPESLKAVGDVLAKVVYDEK